MWIGENHRSILINNEQYINQIIIPRVNERDAPLTLALAPPQPSLKQGKPNLKDELCGEAPLKIRRLGYASKSLELSELRVIKSFQASSTRYPTHLALISS